MLTKRAIRQFIERPRDDSRRYKALSKGVVEAMQRGLPVEPPIWHKLRHHQKQCFLLGVQYRRFGYFLDLGMGKTMISVALARYLKKTGEVQRFLVLVPNRINCPEWLRELAKNSPTTSIVMLAGSSESKWEKLETTSTTLVVTTYMGLVRMVCEPVTIKKGKRKGQVKLKPIPAKMKRLLQQVDGLILDEPTAAANRAKLPFRICRAISKKAKAVFALTGTPFGRDPTPLWGQLYLIDHGKTLGETLGLFRSTFFTSVENYWGGTDYTFNTKKEKLLHTMLAHRTIRYEADKADLPRVVAITKELKLPQDAQAYYERAKTMIIEAHGNYKEMKNAFLRMRQISSGFLGYLDDEKGVRAEFEFSPNPKLEMLLSLAQSTGGEKIIVWHEFVFSGSIICRELKKLDIGHARIYGGTKDAAAEINRFLQDPDCIALVANNSSGAFGGNWQVAKYSAYYESPVSAITRKQTERRNERQESDHKKVFRYDLVVKNTMDERILEFHSEGQSLFDAIIEGKVRV